MMILALTTVAVLVMDQVLKLLLRTGGFESVGLGPFGSLRLVEGRLWAHRVSERGPKGVWLWAVAAGALVVAGAWIPSTPVFVGLLLGRLPQ